MRDALDGDYQGDGAKIREMILRRFFADHECLPAIEHRVHGCMNLDTHFFGDGIVVPLLVDLVLHPFVIADRDATGVDQDVW